MSLSPDRPFTLETKWYLSSYRAASDVTYAIADYPGDGMSFGRWQVYWAGICALLKTSVVLLQVDARRCFPGPLKESLTEAYHELRRDKAAYPIFWEFIDHERNNILKQYEFSAYAAYLNEDGTLVDFPSLFTMVKAKQVLKINKGPYAGRDALEVAAEASSWTKAYLEEAIQAAGLDPNEKVSSANFLRRQQGLPIVLPPEQKSLSELFMTEDLSSEAAKEDE